MSDSHLARTQKVIRRLFIAQLGLLGAVGALVLLGLVFTQHLGSFPFAFFTGALGGSISLLRRLRHESQAVIDEFADSWVSSLMPMLYGGLMAAVAYLLFMSGILTGEGARPVHQQPVPQFHRAGGRVRGHALGAHRPQAAP